MEDKLFYHSSSRDAMAGRGVNEIVGDVEKYAKLNGVANWRRKLSNFHVAPFKYVGKKWRTAEHAFQAAKIALIDDATADKFAIDSGHVIGKGDGIIARKNRKIVLLSGTKLAHWDEIKGQKMHEILYAKFSQHEELAKILLLTQDAALWHGIRSNPPTRQYELEMVRERLRADDSLKLLAECSLRD